MMSNEISEVSLDFTVLGGGQLNSVQLGPGQAEQLGENVLSSVRDGRFFELGAQAKLGQELYLECELGKRFGGMSHNMVQSLAEQVVDFLNRGFDFSAPFDEARKKRGLLQRGQVLTERQIVVLDVDLA